VNEPDQIGLYFPAETAGPPLFFCPAAAQKYHPVASQLMLNPVKVPPSVFSMNYTYPPRQLLPR